MAHSAPEPAIFIVPPQAQQQKVQCGRESWGGSWLFVNTGSDQPQAETMQVPFTATIITGHSGNVTEQLHMRQFCKCSVEGAKHINHLSVVPSKERRSRKKKQYCSSSDNSIWTLIPLYRFCCWHRFLPRWVLNKVLVELVFLPYLGHKTRIGGWKKPKDCLIKLVPCSVLSTFSRRGLTTSQRFSMHSELALSVKKGIPY